ncbi:IS4 family transposase [Streptomyces sp. NPDC012825]|uniref:IS4 family transposase n=1 Tax=Streptomyces sp. NPDC012825 TaxID=3364851 RepID=UPI0036BF1166
MQSKTTESIPQHNAETEANRGAAPAGERPEQTPSWKDRPYSTKTDEQLADAVRAFLHEAKEQDTIAAKTRHQGGRPCPVGGRVGTPGPHRLVDAAIAKHDRAERRRRLLPARLVVYFVLTLCLFARESYEEVLRVLTSGIPSSRALARVNRSSLCRARARLGEDVLATVFRQVAGPLATPATPGAWWLGLRLLALDGTQFDLPDSTSNGDTFDGPSTTGGVPFGFPQVRAVVLAEIGTYGVLDARLGGYRDGERSLAYPLAGSTGPGDLVIADRGFWSVEFAHVFTAVGADLLVRLQSNHLGTAQEELPDGSYLSMARPGKDVRLRAAREGRTLPKHVIYRERWEIELAFNEIKNHLGPGGPIRSRTPEGVRQELWACLAVHHAIRQFVHTAALARPTVDADRVSYLKCVRIIRRSIPARSDRHQAHPLLCRGWAGGTCTPSAGPAQPGVPARDQEAESLAHPEDPSQTRHSPAGPLGPQPDHKTEEQPPNRKTGTQGTRASSPPKE